ncbi:MAG TPA: peroxidase family protein, partial [Solirubrobacteraceae bacterium]
MLLAALTLALPAAAPAAVPSFEARALDDSNNNLAHPAWGTPDSSYLRWAPARYADGAGAPVEGPNARYVSNRVFNSLGVDLFSERNVSQWLWTWGQFVDHTFGHAASGFEEAPIAFNSEDPLESFPDTLGMIPFARDTAAVGSGGDASNPRQQINTVSSFIDASALYGNSTSRLKWLRGGPANGAAAAQRAKLLLAKGYLPSAGARGNAATAPPMVTEGALAGNPGEAVVAGDVRANENSELTAVTTLLAREHNRIVAQLPSSLTNEQRFQIARRVVGAEEQYITYQEFLPAAGVTLGAYNGYDPTVNPELSDEFATVGYRAHSMVNGELHVLVPRNFSEARIKALQARGVGVAPGGKHGNQLELTISQGAAFFDPQIVPQVGLGAILQGLAAEPGYKNDEQIDDALRSVLFGVPGPGADPAACYAEPTTTGCFSGVVDLGAIDVQRGRDNGMPSYNQMREAVGLAPRASFAEVTGESSEELPQGETIEDPHILDFTSLRNMWGEQIEPGSEEHAVSGTRRSTLASRLKATYGSVGKLDAFVGMLAEPHPAGSELGELQQATWRRQFEALRDGDRFFYLNDPVLAELESRYGVSYKHSLRELIAIDVQRGRDNGMPSYNQMR